MQEWSVVQLACIALWHDYNLLVAISFQEGTLLLLLLFIQEINFLVLKNVVSCKEGHGNLF